MIATHSRALGGESYTNSGINAYPGYTETTPDYHATIREKVDVVAVDREYGYEAGYSSEIIEYEEGTLMVDIADARTKRVIWRGWAQTNIEGVIDNRQRMEERINEGTRRMFEQFPPGAGGR